MSLWTLQRTESTPSPLIRTKEIRNWVHKSVPFFRFQVVFSHWKTGARVCQPFSVLWKIKGTTICRRGKLKADQQRRRSREGPQKMTRQAETQKQILRMKNPTRKDWTKLYWETIPGAKLHMLVVTSTLWPATNNATAPMSHKFLVAHPVKATCWSLNSSTLEGWKGKGLTRLNG